MSGLASLGIDLPVLISQIVSFLILFALLRFVAYKPLMKMLDERSGRIQKSMEQAEFIKEQATLAEKETQKRIEEAIREGQRLVDRATQAGEEMKQKAREEAQKEAERLIVRAKGEIEKERDDAIGELRKEFADITIKAAEKVIESSLNKEAHRKLIEKVLDESIRVEKN